MSPDIQLFMSFMLRNNIVFILFFGALLPVCAGLTVKQSLTAGLKFALVLALSGILATGVFNFVPEGLPFLNQMIVLFVSIAGAALLRRWGELQGDWAGMPKHILFVAPTAGIQTYIWTREISGLDGVLVSFGAAAGLYIGIVMTVALMEQLRISEAAENKKTIGVLFFILAILALGFAGFQFI